MNTTEMMMTIRAYPERGPYVSEHCRCEFEKEVWMFTGRLSGLPIVGIPNCQWERELVTKDSEPCPKPEQPVEAEPQGLEVPPDHVQFDSPGSCSTCLHFKKSCNAWGVHKGALFSPKHDSSRVSYCSKHSDL